MGILSSLTKTVFTGSPQYMSRYRASIKLRDALIELERQHKYIVLNLNKSNRSLEGISDTTDLSQKINVLQFESEKHGIHLIIVIDGHVLINYEIAVIIDFFTSHYKGVKKQIDVTHALAFFRENEIIITEHNFLQFPLNHPGIEISSMRMTEIILRNNIDKASK